MAEAGLLLDVRVRPRADREVVLGVTWRKGDRSRLPLWLRAAPVDQVANRACPLIVAAALGLPVSRVTMVAGGKGLDKTLVLEAGEARIREALRPWLQGAGAVGEG
ncbi:MAG: DUF167 domain-containing protein [Candidatus Sericytochromatia bacterium]|nr:DUF167 domain-containing protein [Candidatus Sericytochromatia bacterium]